MSSEIQTLLFDMAPLLFVEIKDMTCQQALHSLSADTKVEFSPPFE
jgi:hypothetical protein